MNWWKIAQLQNFEDRNIWNAKIDDLKDISIALSHLSKLVFQTGSKTQGLLREILATKRLTSYPPIQNLLVEADRVCLDSPHKFADLCHHAAKQVVNRIQKLESERKQFANKSKKNRYKGWDVND